MTDVTPNIPEVVTEVRAIFERYEQALIDKNVDVLDATFWDSPHTIRYAFHENGYGFKEIHAHRVARPPGPGTKEKRIRLEILTLGRDLATVNLEFKGQNATAHASVPLEGARFFANRAAELTLAPGEPTHVPANPDRTPPSQCHSTIPPHPITP